MKRLALCSDATMVCNLWMCLDGLVLWQWACTQRESAASQEWFPFAARLAQLHSQCYREMWVQRCGLRLLLISGGEWSTFCQLRVFREIKAWMINPNICRQQGRSTTYGVTIRAWRSRGWDYPGLKLSLAHWKQPFGKLLLRVVPGLCCKIAVVIAGEWGNGWHQERAMII